MHRRPFEVVSPTMPSIPGYSIKEKIGEGGMAKVYLARQESLDRMVALKIIAPSVTAIDPQASERFLREGRIVAKLTHPNIITIYNIGTAQSFHYMAMEYISGGDLGHRLENNTVRDPLNIIRQIASALGYAHKFNVIHRDIKPANILFREDGSVVLTDFGIAKALSAQTSLTMTGFVAGTPHYMSPEQVRGDPVDARSDLYSLGIVFYEMLAREKPFKGEDSFGTAISHISAPIPTLPEEFSYFQPIIDRLLAKDPDDRYASAERLIRALDQARADLRDGYEEEIDPDRTRIQAPHKRAFAGGIEGPAPESGLQAPRSAPTTTTPFQVLHLAKSWQWALLAVLLIGIVIGGYSWFSAPRIDPQTRWIINMMLEKASRQLQASRFIEPVGDNAYKTYREVLEIMPNNKDALQGVQIIADRLGQQAIDKQRQGAYEESLALIEQALEVAPDNEESLKHKRAVTGLLEDRKLQEKISGLLLQAESYIEHSQYTQPSEANAYQVFQEVLALDPDNKDALKGIRTISTHYAKQAAVKQQEGRLKEALTLAIQGLQIQPDNHNLAALKDRISDNIKTAELTATINDLHTLAEQQLSDSKHIIPAGDNAYETYHKILLLDSRDTRAVRGLERVRNTVTALIASRESSGDYEQALSLIERALQLQPDDTEILSIKKTLNARLEAQQRLEEIQTLERIARQQMRESKLLSPSNDNAYETYQDMLALDPENHSARQGLDTIASKVIELAQIDLRKGHFKDSIEKLNIGLDYYPNKTEFLDMRAEVAELLEKELVKQEIQRLTRLATTQLAASKYTSPVNDNAYTTLRKLETLDPGNSEAADGFKLIADHFMTSAQQALKKDRLSDALTIVDQGIKVFPGNEEMTNLRGSISAKLQEQEHRQQEVSEWLLEADSQIMRSRYVRPEGDNALDTYRRILAIDPHNDKALSGLETMVRNIEQGALDKQQAGDFEQSLALISDGLKINPEHTGLLQLHDTVSSQLNEISQRDRIHSLLARAREQMDAARLTQSKGDNAYETYQTVLRIDPANSQAAEGLSDIPLTYIEIIRQAQSQGAYRESLSLVEEALRTYPDHSVFQEIKNQLDELVVAEQKDQVEDVLLPRAAEQLATLRLTSPKGDNAYETYLRVLEIDPENEKAKKGLNSIAEGYSALAFSQQKKGELRKSLAYIEKGLAVIPDHPGLLEQKEQVSGMLQQMQTEQQVQAEKEIQPEEEMQREKEIQTETSFAKQSEKYRRINVLLMKAENQFSRLKLILPIGDNAHETYKQILEIDSDNKTAIVGLNQIVQFYRNTALRKQREGDLNGSIENVKNALVVYPDREDLRALLSRLEKEMSAKNHETRKPGSKE